MLLRRHRQVNTPKVAEKPVAKPVETIKPKTEKPVENKPTTKKKV